MCGEQNFRVLYSILHGNVLLNHRVVNTRIKCVYVVTPRTLKSYCHKIIIRVVTFTFIISFLNLYYPRIFSSLLFCAQEPHILQFLVIISYVYMELTICQAISCRLPYFTLMIALWEDTTNFFKKLC